jgi:hypothetical protein
MELIRISGVHSVDRKCHDYHALVYSGSMDGIQISMDGTQVSDVRNVDSKCHDYRAGCAVALWMDSDLRCTQRR